MTSIVKEKYLHFVRFLNDLLKTVGPLSSVGFLSGLKQHIYSDLADIEYFNAYKTASRFTHTMRSTSIR